MYKLSSFYISYKLNEDNVIIYSTLTTSIFIFDTIKYNDIIINGNIEKYPNLIPDLLDMGIIYDTKENENEKLKNVRQKLIDEQRGLRSITIAPTMECNARCYYCFENGSKKDCMDINTANQLINFIDENCKEKELAISWFGGEPLLAPNIIDYIVDGLISKNIKFTSTITSNGSLINKELIGKFNKWKIRRIQITIDAIGNTYNKIKNYVDDFKNNAFELVINNIQLLLRNHIRVHIRVNYNPNALDTAEETLEYLYKLFGENDFFYMYGSPLDLNDINKQELPSHFLKFLKKSLEYGYEYNKEYISDNNTHLEKVLNSLMMLPSPVSCYMSYKFRFAVDSNGYLYKCHRFLGRQEYNSGNIFSGIEQNDIFNSFCTSDLVDINCDKCRLLPICQGGCNANRILYGNKNACTHIKNIIEDLVYMYYNEVRNK